MNPFLSNASRPEVLKVAAAFEMVKTASGAVGHAAEIAGLGILARPTVRKMQGKEQSEKSTHMHEVVGLGTLAAPSAYELGKGAIKRFAKKAPGAIVKHAASNGFGQFAGRAAHIAEKAMKPAAQAAAPAVAKAVEAPKKKLTMEMIQAAKKRMAGGGHGGIY